MDPNPLEELKKFSPFINKVNGGKMGIKNENDFDTITNVLVIIKNNIKYYSKNYTEEDKQTTYYANQALYWIISKYVRGTRSRKKLKSLN